MKKCRSESCHTCRRRRLLCDGTKPHCTRCMSSGLACLGYGLLWVLPPDQRGVSSLPDAAESGSMTGFSVSEVHTGISATAKLPKKRGRPRLALMSQSAAVVHKPAVTIGSGFPMTPNMNPVGYASARLAIDCLQYSKHTMHQNGQLGDTVC